MTKHRNQIQKKFKAPPPFKRHPQAISDDMPDDEADFEIDDSYEGPDKEVISPAHLHSKEWVLSRLLAPFCKRENGMWVNPKTGELHETAQGVLNDLISMLPDAQTDTEAAHSISMKEGQ